MAILEEYLSKIDQPKERATMTVLLAWITKQYPSLVPVIKWNQPMFTDHGTFIIGFSISKKHFSISPEVKTLKQFKEEIEQAGYDHTENIIRVNWAQDINYDLLKKLIDFNIADKADFTKFWR
ncbi:iron chaperone [Enterococcus sp. LJL51]|uniref:iron chaperone n=1 Tax=Enterococcus sp. LJL51 TaxID=3416656 RepID=UPI003CF7EC3B